MHKVVAINSIASVSPLGITTAEIWANYLHDQHHIHEKNIGDIKAYIASITAQDKSKITALRKVHTQYKNLDDSVLYALWAARAAVQKSGWEQGISFGINIGSSRGATALFEDYHKDFLNHKKTQTLTSPTTTLGNLSSWVAHDLQNKGPEISHSITCSTALHAMLNGIVWLQSGWADAFLVGGSEASITAFTIAQMQALRIYAKNNPFDANSKAYTYPCQAFHLKKTQNTMVIGEGAGMACLSTKANSNTLAYITGIGYATEMLEHGTSISAGAECLQQSMAMALTKIDPAEVDVIVMHAPGTIKGDSSEYNAIKKVFGKNIPALTTNKWKLGHTFGASGMLSVELAVLMLQHQHFISVPFAAVQSPPDTIQKILVNAVGFGGNAVSVLLSNTP